MTCLAPGGRPPEKEEPMSWTLDGPGGAAVMRAADAEAMSTGQVSARLLLDSSATHEAASVVRVALAEGADGAVPHRHDKSSELFYVLSGSVQLLAGEEILTAGEGDLAVVPPGLPHAFAAPPGSGGELLIIITPGVERFEYFRHLGRLVAGQATLESLLAVQERYDTYFLPSEPWQKTRSGPATG
jgi:quercetin dioxygenase-like cupin family protein